MEEFEVEAYVSKKDAQRLITLELLTQLVILDGGMTTLTQRVLLAFYVGGCQEHTVSGLATMLRAPLTSVRTCVRYLEDRGYLLGRKAVQVRPVSQAALRAILDQLTRSSGLPKVSN